MAAREMSTPVIVCSRGSRRAAQKRRPLSPVDASGFAGRLVPVNVRERLVQAPDIEFVSPVKSNDRSEASAPIKTISHVIFFRNLLTRVEQKRDSDNKDND